MFCLRFIFIIFFSFVGDYSETSEDDVIISQLRVTSLAFSSYPLHEENGGRWEKCLLLKIGPKSLLDGRRDVCKDSFIKNVIWDQLLATEAEFIQS